MQHSKSELADERSAMRLYAITLTRDIYEADDLVQDCMERALHKWDLRHNSMPLRAWLFTMMRNLHISRWRRNRKHLNTLPLEGTSNLPYIKGNQETVVELNQLLTRIMALPNNQREVLVLVTIEGFTYSEVSHMLNVPEGTVMSRLSRARMSLRKTRTQQDAPMLRRVK